MVGLCGLLGLLTKHILMDRKEYMQEYYNKNKDKWKIYYLNYLNRKNGNLVNKRKLPKIKKKITFEKIDKNIILIFD